MKQNSRLTEILNSITELFEFGIPLVESSRTFGSTDGPTIGLRGRQSADIFDSLVEKLVGIVPSIKNTISREAVLAELIPAVRTKKMEQSVFSSQEALDFAHNLQAVPLQEYSVTRPIYGIALASTPTPVLIGDFTLDFGRNMLTADVNGYSANVNSDPTYMDQLFIRCKVKARDIAFASSLADDLFYRFELVFRFLIGHRTDRIEVGIVTYRGAQLRDQFIYSQEGKPISHGTSLHGALQPFLLNDPRFPQIDAAMTRLFQLITHANTNLERHILRCTEWTGQALVEPNEAAAFVKAATALETLFRVEDKGVITSSIMASIAESCAFLLGINNHSALEIEHKVKSLYGVRSSIVHKGKDSVDSDELETFIDICRSSVIRLVSGAEFSGITSAEELHEYFKTRKYAGVGQVPQA